MAPYTNKHQQRDPRYRCVSTELPRPVRPRARLELGDGGTGLSSAQIIEVDKFIDKLFIILSRNYNQNRKEIVSRYFVHKTT